MFSYHRIVRNPSVSSSRLPSFMTQTEKHNESFIEWFSDCRAAILLRAKDHNSFRSSWPLPLQAGYSLKNPLMDPKSVRRDKNPSLALSFLFTPSQSKYGIPDGMCNLKWNSLVGTLSLWTHPRFTRAHTVTKGSALSIVSVRPRAS